MAEDRTRLTGPLAIDSREDAKRAKKALRSTFAFFAPSREPFYSQLPLVSEA